MKRRLVIAEVESGSPEARERAKELLQQYSYLENAWLERGRCAEEFTAVEEEVLSLLTDALSSALPDAPGGERFPLSSLACCLVDLAGGRPLPEQFAAELPEHWARLVRSVADRVAPG